MVKLALSLSALVILALFAIPAPAQALGVCPTEVVESTQYEFVPDVGCDAAGSPGKGKITLVCWGVLRCPGGMDTCSNAVQLVQLTTDTAKTKACKGTGYAPEQIQKALKSMPKAMAEPKAAPAKK